MNFNVKELNELIYSLGITASKGIMCDKELNTSLLNKLYDELNRNITEENDIHMLTSFPINEPFASEVKQPKGISQAILDFVEKYGNVRFTEMNEFYKKKFGSNSFSHILKALQIPYKNRPTKRYLIKVGKNYEVRLANPSNWVVKEY